MSTFFVLLLFSVFFYFICCLVLEKKDTNISNRLGCQLFTFCNVHVDVYIRHTWSIYTDTCMQT